jgi:hypothetical protein
MLADVGGHKSANFALAAAAARSRAFLKQQHHRLRAMSWLPLPKRKSLAVTRS